MWKNNRGVSLLELVVTIGIIVALAGIIMPAMSIIRNNGREAEASGEIVQLDTALMAFFTDNGYYPGPGLQQMVTDLKGTYFSFDAKRLDGNTYKDQWDKPYLYISPGVVSPKGYDLYSMGLLASNGGADVLNRLMAALDSSSIPTEEEKDIQLGQSSGQGDNVIWGLPEPDYNQIIKGALSLLRSTDVGYELAAKINIANIPIEWDVEGILPEGTLAAYFPDTHEILLNLSLFNGPAEIIAAILAHEATHLADHLGSGDMDFDSISEEHDAFYNEAMVWEELTKDKTFKNLSEGSQANVDTQNDNLNMIKKGEEAAREELRQRYPNIPEEDQWGDSYVVPKES